MANKQDNQIGDLANRLFNIVSQDIREVKQVKNEHIAELHRKLERVRQLSRECSARQYELDGLHSEHEEAAREVESTAVMRRQVLRELAADHDQASGELAIAENDIKGLRARIEKADRAHDLHTKKIDQQLTANETLAAEWAEVLGVRITSENGRVHILFTEFQKDYYISIGDTEVRIESAYIAQKRLRPIIDEFRAVREFAGLLWSLRRELETKHDPARLDLNS